MAGKEEGHEHDARQDGQLRGLEAHETEVEPAAAPVDRFAEKVDGNQPGQAGQINRQGATPDPPVVEKRHPEADHQTEGQPDELAAREVLVADPSRAVNGIDAEQPEQDDEDKQRPLQAGHFAEKMGDRFHLRPPTWARPTTVSSCTRAAGFRKSPRRARTPQFSRGASR